MKALITILVIFTLGLGIALMIRHNKAVQQEKADEVHILDLSTRVEETRTKLDEQERVNTRLNTDLNMAVQKLEVTSNETVRLSNDLAKTKADAKASAEAAQAAHEAEMAKSQAKIDLLTKQIDEQTKQLTDLNSAIDSLGKEIGETERKLAASEGDREFLLKELKRLQTEKAELERQFNDLALLRSQISKLREDLSVAKRLEWIRNGIYGRRDQKGAEQLLMGVTPPSTAARPGYDLNVELRQDGAATVSTNKPPEPPKPE